MIPKLKFPWPNNAFVEKSSLPANHKNKPEPISNIWKE